MRTIELREHGVVEASLNQSELAALLALEADVLKVRRGIGGTDVYFLEAQRRVGSVVWPDLGLTLVIRPKLPVTRVLFLLGYAGRSSAWRDVVGVVNPEAELSEATAFAFARQVEWAVRRGLLHGYREVQETSRVMRGRPDFAAQLRRRPGRWVPLEVRYEQFTADVDENRALLAATRRLLRLRCLSKTLRGRLSRLARCFEDVRHVAMTGADVRSIRIHRLNRDYQAALRLGAWVLDDEAMEQAAGGLTRESWLIDLAVVFEDFVITALRDAMGVSEAVMPRGSTLGKQRRLPLDDDRTISLQPDLTLWRDGGCQLIGDVKYRESGKTQGFDNDLKQVLAYALAADLNEAWIIYASGGDEQVVHRVRGRVIRRISIDLNASPSVLLASIKKLSEVLTSSAASHFAIAMTKPAGLGGGDAVPVTATAWPEGT